MIKMTDLEILGEMINDSAKVNLKIYGNSAKASVTLTEPQESRSSVTIHGLSRDAIVIKADKFSTCNIFSGSKGECKRADYVIVDEINGKKIVLHAELKLTKDSEKEIIGQLKGSYCFIRYCCEIAKTFWGEKEFLSDFQYRFACFVHTGSIKKRRTKFDQKSKKNDTPEKFLKVNYPGNFLRFDRLIKKG